MPRCSVYRQVKGTSQLQARVILTEMKVLGDEKKRKPPQQCMKTLIF